MPPSPEARRMARERAAQRRRHIRQIRRTVVVVSVTVFIALFSTIYIQLAAGRDPALTTGKQSTAWSSTTTAAASTTSSSGTSPQSTGQPSAVTTGQS
jgi:hypothetical protein